MDFMLSPAVKVVLTVLAAANGALVAYPGLPPVVYTVCGVLGAVFAALLGTSLKMSHNELKAARAENLALQRSIQVKP